MSDFFQIGNRRLIPLKDVTKIVPYSREYVARLARDGRIAAAQVNRQWYIDPESLKNFFEHAQLEVQARTEYVRELRKQELDLHEWWLKFLETQQTRRKGREKRVVGRTIIVVILGLLVGLLVTDWSPFASPATLATLIRGEQFAASIEATLNNAHETWYETGVVVEDISLKNPTGILLTPVGTTTDAATFFSDPITVEMVTETTGFIHSSTTSSSVPYVRIESDTHQIQSGERSP